MLYCSNSEVTKTHIHSRDKDIDTFWVSIIMPIVQSVHTVIKSPKIMKSTLHINLHILFGEISYLSE